MNFVPPMNSTFIRQTRQIENEIKQLDKEFGEHVQHAIGVIVNRRSNESKIVGSQSKHSKDSLVQGLLVQTLIMMQAHNNWK